MLQKKNVKRPCTAVGCVGYYRGTDVQQPVTGVVTQHPLNRDKCFKCEPRKKHTAIRNKRGPLTLPLCTFGTTNHGPHDSVAHNKDRNGGKRYA
jgi:hypothetical protein